MNAHIPLNENYPASESLVHSLVERMGFDHAHQRLTLEQQHHHAAFSRVGKFVHIENWYSIHGLIRHCFRLVGLHGRAKANTTRIQVRHNDFVIPHLPEAFNGFRVLHLSDLHVDMHPPAVHALIKLLRTVEYDLCVMTGDYRAKTFGDYQETLQMMGSIRSVINKPVYAVLGNHDSILMVPGLEALGIQLLLNEQVDIRCQGEVLTLAGIDDAHFFGAHDIGKSLEGSPEGQVKILLSHTPEVFRQARGHGVDVFLCGHTHGGQICLPGGLPLTLDAKCPRFVGKGAWAYRGMQGYTSAGSGTSIVNLRLNCPPEITLHRLNRS